MRIRIFTFMHPSYKAKGALSIIPRSHSLTLRIVVTQKFALLQFLLQSLTEAPTLPVGLLIKSKSWSCIGGLNLMPLVKGRRSRRPRRRGGRKGTHGHLQDVPIRIPTGRIEIRAKKLG